MIDSRGSMLPMAKRMYLANERNVQRE